MKKKLKNIIRGIFVLLCLGMVVVLGINGYVKYNSQEYILSPSDVQNISDADCILVLGCGVRPDGTPSDMLSDRLQRGIELYQTGVSSKIIMSGDHGTKEYDEVNTMKKLAMEAQVPSENIFMDHAGFSTYDSMYRLKEIFGVKKVVIVSQKYHLYRALYIANELGVEAYGVDADYRAYSGQSYRDAREILARFKDFLKVIFKPEPTFLGDAIPVGGNGNITND